MPIARTDRLAGHLLPGEESASLLLWAWPRLIGWRHRINWIFSPVVGNKAYPGDLWGLDSRGNLLVVETKLDRGLRSQDPLVDFVPYAWSRAKSKLWRADSLYPRWRRLVRQEEGFIRECRARLDSAAPLNGTFPGVLPYSRHRDTVWRWQALFQDRIASRFEDGSYRRAVERSFRSRREHGDRAPIFIGVIATVGAEPPTLSARGEAALHNLVDRVGRQRVLLRAMRVEPYGAGSIRIRSWAMSK